MRHRRLLGSAGVNIAASPEVSAKLLRDIHICFLFAQNYHIAMKYVAPVRKELGIRTIFNILGPLANPAGANLQLLGVYDEALVEPLARVLHNLGVTSAMVVHGQDGLDEISLTAPTDVCEVRGGEFLRYTLEPETFGLSRCTMEELQGGTPAENAGIARSILSGEPGAKRDAVLLNSAAALHVATGVSLEAGLVTAVEILDSGKALVQLEDFIRLSNLPA